MGLSVVGKVTSVASFGGGTTMAEGIQSAFTGSVSTLSMGRSAAQIHNEC